ncbi:hypothetical protein L541_2945 [Bordetella hinzii CA90 BAL1384]|uniref:Uncharacterized protein n=1 Tax=Bordetella hinzii OH87 BAL007II TaxID=1331262 RepID=A0ABR4R4F0_9BORD|nr:hypothetical protein L544_2704 [Bordetella hinzii OH87 BAL007II]KCB34597.1 hypothetical protein L541_2945 [Bordetella hinzii CA90 BAL1384]KCB39466.1 hypothetical protein L539_3171 [Bordetella hinzii 5132]
MMWSARLLRYQSILFLLSEISWRMGSGPTFLGQKKAGAAAPAGHADTCC